MQWLEHDGVGAEELPPWATRSGEALDAGRHAVWLRPEGVVLAAGRRFSAVRWHEILAVIQVGGRRLLAAARRPPRPPWFEFDGPDGDRVGEAVLGRLDADQGGYRNRRVAVPLEGLDETFHAVLSHRPVPGAVEVPARRYGMMQSAGVAGLLGGLTLGGFGLLAGGLFGGLTFGAIGLATGGLSGVASRNQAQRSRVLVLTPVGFIAGLDGEAPRIVAWSDVGRFREGLDRERRPALEVVSPDGAVVARVSAFHFGDPLGVIVPVAEAYRLRAG